ncbi:hypothetical protein JNUCC42_00070 [Brevibacterium sp. JNUCC-42]|nr:hypothetical protein JNUCC42_00070 [Brevibacterium sp. JNUCC-42]
MNKKALKWIIGSLALAIIVPAAAFMLIQPDEKMNDQECVDAVTGLMMKCEGGAIFSEGKHIDDLSDEIIIEKVPNGENETIIK